MSILEALVKEPDFAWLSINATYIKVHPHAAGAPGGNEAMNHTKGGLNTKLHLAVDASGRPLRAIITEGSEADCKQAGALIAGMEAGHLLADRGYDTNQVLCQAQDQKMDAVIPPTKSRKVEP